MGNKDPSPSDKFKSIKYISNLIDLIHIFSLLDI